MTQAAKWFDPVLGIDIHMVIVPPSPAPVPLPHPFIGVVFDPIGLAIGAAIGLVFGGGGLVLINGLPAGNTGTEVKAIPHFPMPPGVSFHACDMPPGNEGSIVTGSKTVTMMGSSAGRLTSMVMSCNFPINLPTSLCLAVPMGAPTLVGGPTSFDIMAAVTQGIRTKWVSSKLHSLLKAKPGSRLSKVICFATGHPVDVMTGAVFTSAQDVWLPGAPPLLLERNYYSRDAEAGDLGPGWSHTLEAGLDERDDCIRVQLEDGRQHLHPPLRAGESLFEPADRYDLTRTAGGYVLRFTDGRTLEFAPTSGGRWSHPLTRVHTGQRRSIQLIHAEGRLAGATDSAGRQLRFLRDAAGRLTAVRVRRGALHGKWIDQVRYRYDDEGRLAAAIDPRGAERSYTYRGGVLIRETDRNGLSFHFEYDWDHPDGWCVHTWGDGGLYERHITYDKLRHVTVVDEGGGGRVHYFGNDAGLVDRMLDAMGGEWRYAWHPTLLRKTEEQDPTGARTRWNYDARGNLIERTDALGQTTRWRHDAGDRPVEMIDAAGHVWRRGYDERGNLVEETDPAGGTRRYRHDDSGDLVAAYDGCGRGMILERDAAGQVIARVDRSGRTTRFAHDELGRLVARTGALGGQTRLHWDDCDRVIAVERSDGQRLSRDHDGEGNLVRLVDGRGQRWRYAYTGLGKLAQRIDPTGAVYRRLHDREERVVEVRNEADEAYRYSYDLCGRLVREVGFDGRTLSFTRDPAGHCTSITNARGQVLRFERDLLGRLTRQTGTDGTWSAYRYDPRGLLCEAANAHGVVRLDRDAVGRVVREQTDDGWIDSAYDDDGQRVRRATSFGHTAHFGRDSEGRLVAVRVPRPHEPSLPNEPALLASLDWEVSLELDEEGAERVRRLPGGIEGSWERDPLGRPTSHRTARRDAGDVATLLREEAYRWDAADRLCERGERRFEHDARGALVASDGPEGPQHRASDAVGNLYRSADRSDRTYGPGGRPERDAGAVYLHDADGNLIARQCADGSAWRYTWDSLGQLVEVTRPDGGRVRFAYDALGRRISSEADHGPARRFTWDGHFLLSEGTSDDPHRVAWVFAAPRFDPLLRVEGGRCRGFLTDHLGAPTGVYDDDGAAVWSGALDIHGEPVGEGDAGEVAPRWPGQWADAAVGLTYNRFRWYDPGLGAYVSPDPLRLGGGPHLRRYVADPCVSIDPFGLAACNQEFSTREDALNAAYERAGIPKGTKADAVWEVGDDFNRIGSEGYLFSADKGAQGRYMQFETDQGSRVISEHLVDPNAPMPHFHAGQPKGDPTRNFVDFGWGGNAKNAERYQQIGDKHHFYYPNPT